MDDAAVVNILLRRFMEDAEDGGLRPVNEYVEEYPDRASIVRRLHSEFEASSQQATASETAARLLVRERMRADRDAGALRSLKEYVAAFAGQELVVAEEFAHAVRIGDQVAEENHGRRFGRYRLVARLGSGGQGTVYLAEDPGLSRRVALKILPAWAPGHEEALIRLRREAELASRLNDPGICTVYETGVISDRPYIAMRYVEGRTLAEIISTGRTDAGEGASDNPLVKNGSAWSTRLIERMALSVHAAHEESIVHRDLKPANVIITTDDQPVVLDFGLARSVGSEQNSLTHSGDALGTPSYMAPEQINGLPADRRTDVYALGVILFECLTLERPYSAATREALFQAITSGRTPKLSDLRPEVHRDLAVICETSLARDPNARYRTAQELAEDLARHRRREPIRARRTPWWTRARLWVAREPVAASLVALSVVAVIAITTLATAWWKDRPLAESARRASFEEQQDLLLSEASYNLTERDIGHAIEIYEQILRTDASSPAAIAGLVMAYLRRQQPQMAANELHRRGNYLSEAVARRLEADVLRATDREEEALEIEKDVPPPVTPEDCFLLANREILRGENGEEEGFHKAVRLASSAILLSRGRPQLSHYSLRIHAAGHVKDKAIVTDMVTAMRRHWPNSALALQISGVSLLFVDDPAFLTQASAVLRESLAIDDRSMETHFYLGLALIQQGSLDEAIGHLRMAVSSYETVAKCHQALAVAYAKRGDTHLAIQGYKKAIELGEGTKFNYARLGKLLYENRAYERSALAYSEALKLDPNLAEALLGSGLSLAKQGQWKEAFVFLQKGLKKNPDDVSSRIMLAYGLLHFRRFDEALKECETARNSMKDPNSPEQTGLMADIHAVMSAIQYARKNDDEAISLARKSLAVRTDIPTAHATLGLALRRKGHNAEAIRSFQDVIKLAPEEATYPFYLARALEAAGQLEAALVAYGEAVAIRPDFASALGSMSSVQTRLGRYREALASMRLAHQFGSQRSDWKYPSADWVASAEKAVAQVERAERHLAEQSAPETPEELIELAAFLVDLGHGSEAMDWYQRSFSMAPRLANDLRQGYRLHAIHDALRAASKQPNLASNCRTTARRWLEENLAFAKASLEDESLPELFVQQELLRWTQDANLAAVRGEKVTELPETEQQPWTDLWRAIEDLLGDLE